MRASRLSQPNPIYPQKLTPKEISNARCFKGKFMQNIDYETFLNIRFVSHYTGLCANTVLTAAKTGSFPSSFQFDDDEVWLSADIADWLENSPHSPSNFAWRAAA